MGVEDAREEALAHFGVKGMKWGVRREKKNLPTSVHPDYPKSQRQKHFREFGQKAVKRINDDLHEGKPYGEAVAREQKRAQLKSRIAVGAAAAFIALQVIGPILMSEVSNRAEANRHRRDNPRAGGLSSKPAKQPKVIKPNRKGVYKVTTL